MQSKCKFSRLYIIETQCGGIYMNKEIIKLINKLKMELQIMKYNKNTINNYCATVGNLLFWFKMGVTNYPWKI